MGRLLTHMRARRKELGMTIEHLSVKAGISGSFLSKIEHGELVGSDATINKLANALGITPGDIRYEQLGGEGWERSSTEVIEADGRFMPSLPKKHDFIPGTTYKIHRGYGKAINTPETRKFDHDEGRHHIFTSPIGGWRESYTDEQLAGSIITPV